MKNRQAILKVNRDFIRVYKQGENFVNAAVVTYVLKKKRGLTRIGVTASKKVGGAVTRNRARRVIKAAILPLENQLPKHGYDIVFVARGKTARLKSHTVSNVVKGHLTSAGVIRGNEEVTH